MARRFKYERVAARLRERIAAGAYADGRLPQDDELATEFAVSKVPVNRALNLLRDEGLLERIKGKGTFVRAGSRPLTLLQQVGVLTGNHDHFYGPLHQAICRELMRHDCFALSVQDAVLSDDQDPDDSTRRAIRRLVGAPIRGLIVNGLHYWRFRFLDDVPCPAVIVHCFDAAGELPGPAVLTDMTAGTAAAVDHLADLGHQRIALMTVRMAAPLADISREHHERTPLGQVAVGYRRAMVRRGLADYIFVSEKRRGTDVLPDERREDYGRLFHHAPRPTAVICSSDFLAVNVCQVAAEFGLRVPDDLAVVGFYNTPWSEDSPVPLTSVDCRVEELARRSVRRLFDRSGPATAEFITPHLVIRNSSGGTL